MPSNPSHPCKCVAGLAYDCSLPKTRQFREFASSAEFCRILDKLVVTSGNSIRSLHPHFTHVPVHPKMCTRVRAHAAETSRHATA